MLNKSVFLAFVIFKGREKRGEGRALAVVNIPEPVWSPISLLGKRKVLLNKPRGKELGATTSSKTIELQNKL